DQDHPGLTVVVADSFQELVIDSDRDVFLDVYADWCGPCVEAKPHFHKLANLLRACDDIGICSMGLRALSEYWRLLASAMETDIDILVGAPGGTLRYFENLGSGAREIDPFFELALGHAVPRIVDWDGDGDLDLLVGADDGQVHFYSRLSEHSLHYQGPVFSKLSEPYGFSAVDWDGDGDLDIISCGEDPGVKLRFFERVETGELKEMTGTSNPFAGFRVPMQREPCHIYAADWDGDGDADFMYVGQNLRYFTRTARGTLVQRERHLNPFYDLQRKEIDLQTLTAALNPQVELFLRHSFKFVDWNRDGDLDIIAGPVASNSSLRFFARERVRLVAEVPCAVDWDGDGDTDLLVGCSNGTVAYYEQTPQGLQQRVGSANPFDGISVDLIAVPRAADWDGDGDTDLLLSGFHSADGEYDGSVRYFERMEDGRLEERKGPENPFSVVLPDGEMVVVPRAVDWDSDGDLDLLVAGAAGQVRYFERLADGSLHEHIGVESPFNGLEVGPGALEVTDFDGDGSLDLLVGTSRGRVRFFKQLANQSFTELTGSSNPLAGVRARFAVMPYAVDWDQDGDTDLLAGVHTGGVSGVLVFNRGYCNWHDWCLSRGFTKGKTDTCSCILRYDLKDCSGCGEDHFSGPPDASLSRECLACPGGEDGFVCSRRGYCRDDAAALREFPERSRLQLSAVTGNGSCTCNEPFEGEGCENGECPAGQEYHLEELFTCQPCFPGWFKAQSGNSNRCQICDAGHFSSDWGSASCSACRSLHFRSVVDVARISCDFATINVPVAIGVMLCSILLFLPLPMMFCHTIPVSDMRLQQAGVTISTTGRHWLLANRLAMVSFQKTEVPWLDQGSYAVRSLSERQLLLCDKQGAPIFTGADTSCGSVHFLACHSIRMTGMFGVPFFCWLQFFGGCLAGVLYMANVWQESPGFYATYLELLMMLLGALAALATLCWRKRALSQSDLQRDLHSFEGQLQDLRQNPQGLCPRGHSRAITAGQLWDFFIFWQSYICSRNMYYVVSNVVKPLTRPRKVSYAELAGSCCLQWFVSHYWGTPFCHFVGTVRKHAETLSDPSPVSWMLASYWVCSFANNQWRVEEEVGMSWDQSSFYLALRSGTCQGTVMVFDNDALPLTRSWCLFELLQTAELSRNDSRFLGLQICTPSGVMNHGQTNIELAMVISKKLADLNLRDAQASCLEDKHMIDRLVAERPGGFEQMNAYLTQAVNAALQATALRFQEVFKLFLRGDKQNPIGFKGQRNLKGFLTFLRQHTKLDIQDALRLLYTDYCVDNDIEDLYRRLLSALVAAPTLPPNLLRWTEQYFIDPERFMPSGLEETLRQCLDAVPSALLPEVRVTRHEATLDRTQKMIAGVFDQRCARKELLGQLGVVVSADGNEVQVQFPPDLLVPMRSHGPKPRWGNLARFQDLERRGIAILHRQALEIEALGRESAAPRARGALGCAAPERAAGRSEELLGASHHGWISIDHLAFSHPRHPELSADRVPSLLRRPTGEGCSESPTCHGQTGGGAL
ncbi:PDIL1-4, partial [Symbiodinium sp. KB8]